MQVSALGDTLLEEGGKKSRPKQSYLDAQNKILLAGFVLIITGVLFLLIGMVVNDSTGTTLLLMNIGVSAGLIVATLADVDINLNGKHGISRTDHMGLVITRGFTAVCSIAIFAPLVSAYVTNMPEACLISVIPLYVAIRWNQVLGMEHGFPHLSTLMTMEVAAVMIVFGIAYFTTLKWAHFIVGAMFFLFSAAAVYTYFGPSPWQARSETIRFYMSFYILNLALGMGLLIQQLTDTFAYHHLTGSLFKSFSTSSGHWPLVAWFSAPVHILPSLTMIVNHQRLHGMIGLRWLDQRSFNASNIAQGQSIAPDHGSLVAVQQAISAGIDLNAHIHIERHADAFTLLILACFNKHEGAADLLLGQDTVQVNKGSLRQHWTPLYVAAMRGNSVIVAKLLRRGADVHVLTADEQSALLAATTFGHTQIVQQLMEAGARKGSAWMGVDASAAANRLGHGSIVVALRSYESHFQGYIREVQRCSCVVSWPGIYSQSW
jgi:hypothetical protein